MVEAIDIVDGPEMPRVLLPNDDAQPAAGLDAVQVAGTIDPQEFAGVSSDELIPAVDVAQGTGVNIAIREAHRGMENRGSRGAQLLEIMRSKAGRLGLPGRQLRVVERQQAQHVDDSAAVNQIESQRGIRGFVWHKRGLGQKAEAPSLNHRRCDSKRCAFEQTTARKHWITDLRKTECTTAAR